MKNIQFLTDYSSHSVQVYHYALQLAHQFGATLTAVHVFTPDLPEAVHELPKIAGSEAADQFERYVDAKWDKERERMDYFIQEHTPATLRDVPLQKELAFGHPNEEILRLQENTDFDLAIMGLNSSNSFANNLFGDTALAMIDRAKLPVMLIPPKVKFQGIRRILFPTCLRPVEIKITNYLLEWTKAFQGKLVCFHECFIDAKKPDDFTAGMLAVKRQMEPAVARGDMEFSVIEGKQKELAEHIESELAKLDADLLVMQTHRRGAFAHLFGDSTTKEVASDVFVPLLVVKDEWFERIETEVVHTETR